MRYQEKVDFLEGYQRAMARIQAFQAEYERWETIGEKVTQTLSLTPAGGGNNEGRVARASLEMVEISKQIEDEITNALTQRDAIKDAIAAKCKKKRYADLLTYRYISGLKNYRIAMIIGKEPKTISNALRRAISDLDI